MGNQSIMPHGAAMAISQGFVEPWTMAPFAELWFRDTVEESKQEGADHRWKEIVFAVCFIESYLSELVRDQIFISELKATLRYFPVNGRQRGIVKRCRDVFTELHRERKLTKPMKWQSTIWSEFERLVTIRHGLVHASVSRPSSPSLPKDAKPTPKPEDAAMVGALAHRIAKCPRRSRSRRTACNSPPISTSKPPPASCRI